MSDLNASIFKDHLYNLEVFIDAGRGQVTIGAIKPVACGALASEGRTVLVALVRRDDESVFELLISEQNWMTPPICRNPETEMTICSGACHCGDLAIEYKMDLRLRTPALPSDIPSRYRASIEAVATEHVAARA